jgi:mRNA interferase RelE/StbE
MFEVVLSPDAEAFYATVDRPFAKKLARGFLQLERDPRRHNNIKRLTGEFAGYLRYRIDDATNRMLILTIAHRREVYE